jgi:hypothetical protein
MSQAKEVEKWIQSWSEWERLAAESLLAEAAGQPVEKYRLTKRKKSTLQT